MLGWIRRMTPRQLMFGWLGYWAILGVTTLSRPVAMAYRVSRPDARGSIAASFENTDLTVKMIQNDATVWSATASLTAILLWLSVPPLVMWFIWVLLRPRRVVDAGLRTPTPAPALGAAPPPIESFGVQRERTPVPITPLP